MRRTFLQITLFSRFLSSSVSVPLLPCNDKTGQRLLVILLSYPVAISVPAKVVLESFVVHPEMFDNKIIDVKNQLNCPVRMEARSLSQFHVSFAVRSFQWSDRQFYCLTMIQLFQIEQTPDGPFLLLHFKKLLICTLNNDIDYCICNFYHHYHDYHYHDDM